jgi:hypothetical protein
MGEHAADVEDDLANDLGEMSLGDNGYNDFLAACERHGVRPTRAMFRRLLTRNHLFSCGCCVQVYETKRVLEAHMRRSKHFYGQETLRMQTKEILLRVNASHPGLIADMSSDRAFADLSVHYEALTPAEKQTYANIFYIKAFLIRTRRGRPSN